MQYIRKLGFNLGLMGCSAPKTRLEGLEIKVDFRLNDLEIPEVNDLFSESIPILEKIEEARHALIDKRIELYLRTGACCAREPDIKLAMKGLFYTVACETQGQTHLAQLETSENDPCIVAKGEVSEGLKELIRIVSDYINEMYVKRNLLNEIKGQLDKLKEVAYSDKVQGLTDLIKNTFSNDQFKIPGLIGKFHENLNRVRNGIYMFMNVERVLNSSERLRDEALEMLDDIDEMAGINKIGFTSSSINMTEPHQILWFVVDPSERYPNAEEGYKIWEDKLRLSTEV